MYTLLFVVSILFSVFLKEVKFSVVTQNAKITLVASLYQTDGHASASQGTQGAYVKTVSILDKYFLPTFPAPYIRMYRIQNKLH